MLMPNIVTRTVMRTSVRSKLFLVRLENLG